MHVPSLWGGGENIYSKKFTHRVGEEKKCTRNKITRRVGGWGRKNVLKKNTRRVGGGEEKIYSKKILVG